MKLARILEAGFILVALFVTPSFSNADSGHLQQCGPLDQSSDDVATRIFIEDPTGNLSPEFVFLRSYLSPWSRPEHPTGALSVAIHMETGEPVADYGSTPPQEYDHFSMLIQYGPTVGERVGLLATFFGTLGAGPRYSRVDHVTLYPNQELVEGFLSVDTSGVVIKNSEIGFRYDREEGTLGPEFLSCREIGSVPNPSCSLYLYERDYRLKLNFNRFELHRLARIEELARQFVNCSLQREETR